MKYILSICFSLLFFSDLVAFSFQRDGENHEDSFETPHNTPPTTAYIIPRPENIIGQFIGNDGLIRAVTPEGITQFILGISLFSAEELRAEGS